LSLLTISLIYLDSSLGLPDPSITSPRRLVLDLHPSPLSIQAVGQCATMWSVLLLGIIIVFSSLFLIVLPVINGQITTITALYSEAERSLQGLIAEASALTQTPERLRVVFRISSHISLLQPFEKADRLRAKFLGISVTWSTVKTYFLTLFTIEIGLWSVFRNANIVLTLQSACPIQP